MSSKKTYYRSKNELKIKNIALCGILLALSAGISAAESMLPLPLGVKPGFSNLPVMFSMTKQGGKYGFAVCILRSVFVLFTRGFTAFLMSLTGGVLSYIAMLFLYRKTDVSLMLLSVCGALIHNLGQLVMASFLMNTAILGYSPILLISGCIAGCATGIALKFLSDALDKTVPKEKTYD